jgi:hypothetical protein
MEPAGLIADLAEIQAVVGVDVELPERIAPSGELVASLLDVVVVGDDHQLAAELDVAAADRLEIDAGVRQTTEQQLDVRG